MKRIEIKIISNCDNTKLSSYNVYCEKELCKCCKSLQEVKAYINYMRITDNVKPLPYRGYIIINIDIGREINPKIIKKFENDHPNAKYTDNIDLRKNPYYIGVIYNIYADEKDMNTYKVYYTRYGHLYTKKRIARFAEEF